MATDRYHKYRRPPTGRPIDPGIHKTAPTTNKDELLTGFENHSGRSVLGPESSRQG
jgi:CobQ-like glutamine amidotransferase family enzyme